MSCERPQPCRLEPPVRLRRLDARARADHAFLSEADRCDFLAEYIPSRTPRSGGISQLVHHFKCAPSVARANPRRQRDKCEAIATLAQWLRLALPRHEAEQSTWVPIPPSRCRTDPDFDDRLLQTLHLAFADYDVDVRGLVYQRCNTAADHVVGTRLRASTLQALLCLDAQAIEARPLRRRIVLFDDVLTSGKHYRCCERSLHQALPAMPIDGVFLLRRALPHQRFGCR